MLRDRLQAKCKTHTLMAGGHMNQVELLLKLVGRTVFADEGTTTTQIALTQMLVRRIRSQRVQPQHLVMQGLNVHT